MKDLPPVELQHASLWECRRWTPAVHDDLPKLWDADRPVWIVSCRHAVPSHHKIGRRRALVAMMPDKPVADIARELGAGVETIRADRAALGYAPRRRDPANVAAVESRYQSETASEIAQSLGITRSAVTAIARDRGLRKKQQA